MTDDPLTQLLGLIKTLTPEQKDAITKAAGANARAAVNRATKTSPLLEWLRAANPFQREELAQAAGTKTTYLYQLGASDKPNPSLRMAHAIVVKTAEMSERVKRPGLTYLDLLVPAK
jgi:hypothetical protein